MFDETTVQQVWNKGAIALEHDPNNVRKDIFGNLMVRTLYGSLSAYGWEIDHITAKANGGSDSLFNLQPLHWKANRSKSDRPIGLAGMFR